MMHIIVINVEGHNHFIVVGVLYSLSIDSSKGDKFIIYALPYVPINLYFQSSCISFDIILGRMIG